MHRLSRSLAQQSLRSGFRTLPRTELRPRVQVRRLTRRIPQYGTQSVKLQAVRIRKPGLFANRQVVFRRILSLLIYGGAIYIYFGIVTTFFEFDDDDEKVAGGEENDQEALESRATEGDEGIEKEESDAEEIGPPFYAEEESMFIPMTLPKKLPRTYYRGSDPEWQEFIAFNKDPERKSRARDAVTQILRTTITEFPLLARTMGKDTKVGTSWLIFAFPDGPPQEYERSGLEIGDDFIAWSQQKIDQNHLFRLQRALWPSTTFNSLFNATVVFAGIQYRKLKQTLGIENRDPRSIEERWRMGLELLAKQQQLKDNATAKTASEQGGMASTGGASDSAEEAPRAGTSATKRQPWQISLFIPSAAVPGDVDIPIAAHAFQRTLAETWENTSIRREPPRGTVVVEGMVEFVGQRARLFVDVQSYYDPKASKVVFTSLHMRLALPLSQRPKGGH